MTFAPGSFSSTSSASSAVVKSPGTNSPESSTKKQRSASPSKATPRSAPSSRTVRTMNSRFSGRSRLASDRQRPAPHDLHPRVLLRIVRGGHADAAVELELPDREVQLLGADEAE